MSHQRTQLRLRPAITLGTLFVFICVLVSVSDAATQYYMPAALGQGINGGASCFYEDHGSEHNTCGTAQYWNFPLLTDASHNATYITTSVEVYGATSSNTVGCYGYSVEWGSNELYGLYQGTTVYPSTFGTVTLISPGTFYNGLDYVQMVCVVNPGGYINNINYN